jgi:glycosyltransferase involved in cell wall biosynthesis
MTALPPKTALVHDWLNGMRGGERCLELLAAEYPGAPIYTLLYQPECVSEAIRAHDVHVSGLSRLPFFRDRYRWFLPLFPSAVEAFRLPPDTRLVVSTSHCVAKGVRPPRGARHLCYCFTPMRYAWSLREDYFPSRFSRALLGPALDRLQRWDRAASERVDRFVAISRYIRTRIETAYGRDAAVVYPPVRTDFHTPDPDSPGTDDGYDLIVSALVPYKRIDIAVRAYAATGRPLRIAGSGSELRALQTLAAGAPNIQFVGHPDDAGIRQLYRRCRFLLFPGIEDFGIVPVEAQACGKPVIAYGEGGLLETVRDRRTGLFFGAQTPESLADAVERAAGMAWDPAAIRENALRFSADRFLDGIRKEIARLLERS